MEWMVLSTNERPPISKAPPVIIHRDVRLSPALKHKTNVKARTYNLLHFKLYVSE